MTTSVAAPSASVPRSSSSDLTLHDLLEMLTREELQDAASFFEVRVTQRLSKSDLVDALVASGKVELAPLLQRLLRERIRHLCQAFGLDATAGTKDVLIGRVVAAVRARRTPVPPPTAPTGPTLPELEKHLWEAANILRGSPVDRSDWKAYILPLLFFKRICDVWDEEHALMLAEYGGDYADQHRFQIPDGAHWADVRGATRNVGARLANAMRAVEAANQKHLYGVFGDAAWTNKERLPDELLNDLIEHFSALSLANGNVAADMMGDAYEYLIKKFADSTNKKAGEFYTPRSVVRLIIDILDPVAGDTVYDPACGTGGMLLAAVAHARAKGGDPRRFFGKLHGQEKNLTTEAVARMNLFLHEIDDFAVQRGDTLRNPVFTDPTTGGLASFDVVVANPPFSLEDWGREIWETDPWGRAFAGLPTDSNADMAWVQHMVKSMAPDMGRMGVVLPQGALFRGGVEAQIRRHLLEKDLVDAVVGLAPNLFYGTGLAACVLILRQKKPKAHRGKVLVVDASTVFRRGRAQNFMDPTHGEQILGWVQGFADVEDRARVVDLAEIAKEGWTLNISRYVLPPIGADIPPLPEAVAAFKDALAKCREAEDNLRRVMHEGGWLE